MPRLWWVDVDWRLQLARLWNGCNISSIKIVLLTKRELIRSEAKRRAEIVGSTFSFHCSGQTSQGLYATTLCSFLVVSLFTLQQVNTFKSLNSIKIFHFSVFIQLLPNTILASVAMMVQCLMILNSKIILQSFVIVLDIMSISHVYLLLAFSPALRYVGFLTENHTEEF